MKTQRQSTRLALWLDAEKATRWCRLGFKVEDDSKDQRGAGQILQAASPAHLPRPESLAAARRPSLSTACLTRSSRAESLAEARRHPPRPAVTRRGPLR